MDKQALETNRQTFLSLIPLIGKQPTEVNWQQHCKKARPFNPKDFEGYNVGIPCGPANGILVLDIDNIDGAKEYLSQHGCDLPETRLHITGTENPHFIYEYPTDGKVYGNRSIKDAEGNTIFDIRGLGGQVVGPGSIHPDTGKLYTVGQDLPIAEAHEW